MPGIVAALTCGFSRIDTVLGKVHGVHKNSVCFPTSTPLRYTIRIPTNQKVSCSMIWSIAPGTGLKCSEHSVLRLSQAFKNASRQRKAQKAEQKSWQDRKEWTDVEDRNQKRGDAGIIYYQDGLIRARADHPWLHHGAYPLHSVLVLVQDQNIILCTE